MPESSASSSFVEALNGRRCWDAAGLRSNEIGDCSAARERRGIEHRGNAPSDPRSSPSCLIAFVLIVEVSRRWENKKFGEEAVDRVKHKQNPPRYRTAVSDNLVPDKNPKLSASHCL